MEHIHLSAGICNDIELLTGMLYFRYLNCLSSHLHFLFKRGIQAYICLIYGYVISDGIIQPFIFVLLKNHWFRAQYWMLSIVAVRENSFVENPASFRLI